MAKPFKNLVEKMSPQSRARISKRTAEMASEMALQELREAGSHGECPPCSLRGASFASVNGTGDPPTRKNTSRGNVWASMGRIEPLDSPEPSNDNRISESNAVPRYAMSDLVKKVYQAFDPGPLSPEQADLYVQLDEVRGSSGLVRKLAQTIRLSSGSTCLLLAGHVGSGKSTELRRLQNELEGGDDKRFVVFCEITEDIDTNDADFPDLLIAIVRQIAGQFRTRLDHKLKPGYFKQRWAEIKDLLGQEVDLKTVGLETGLAKFSATIKSSPNTRLEIRKLLEPRTDRWIDAANDVISEAVLALSNKGYSDLVVIVDGLDKLPVEKRKDLDTSIAERLFINRHAQLTALHCHTIYTLPIALAYSCQERDIASLYNLTAPPVVPMTKIKHQNGRTFKKGFEKFRDIVSKRIEKVGATIEDIFESDALLDEIIACTGGQPRLLMTLIREALVEKDVPIEKSTVETVARKVTHSYERQLRQEHWAIIGQVKKDHVLKRTMENDGLYMELLANRAILQYVNDREWYGLNPLLPKSPGPS